MVNSDLPSVCLADGTIIGNITPSELARYTPIGVACTTEIPDFIRLRHRVVDDTECRKLYALAYSGSRHD